MMNQENSNALKPNNGGNAVPFMPNENIGSDAAVYPEIFYKLMPFVTMICDMLYSSGTVPAQQDIDDLTDYIHEEFCKTYPDMEKYMQDSGEAGTNESVPTVLMDGGFRSRFRPRGFRRRGLGRDLITSLLLSQLFGRGYYYPQYYPRYPYPYYTYPVYPY